MKERLEMTSSSSGWADLVRQADRVRESLHFRGDTDEADLVGALRDELSAEKRDCEIIANALDEERAYSAHLRDEVLRAKEWGRMDLFMELMEVRRWAAWLAAENEYYRVNLDYADSTLRIKNIGISRRLTDLAEARNERDEACAVIERVRNACATPYDEIAADGVREIVEDFYSSREK